MWTLKVQWKAVDSIYERMASGVNVASVYKNTKVDKNRQE
jgi:hypothetical protein